MTDAPACPLPGAPQLFDTPHPQVGDMQRDVMLRAGLDLTGCNLLTVLMGLNEFDQRRRAHLTHRFETWPDAVRALMESTIDEWVARNGATVCAVTTAIYGTPEAFYIALHWRRK